MKFLADAQLPKRLAHFLADAGHDTVHTSELADGNASTDDQVIAAADSQGRVVITKDRDFRDAHLLRSRPRKLLMVTIGNSSNDALLRLFETHLDAVINALGHADFVELRAEFLVVHARPDPGGGTDI